MTLFKPSSPSDAQQCAHALDRAAAKAAKRKNAKLKPDLCPTPAKPFSKEEWILLVVVAHIAFAYMVALYRHFYFN
jgi:hypothetical protein